MLACLHSLSFVRPVSALEQDMAHRLAPVATLALVGVSLVDGVEVGPEADLGCTHLRDDGAYLSVCARMCGEHALSRPDSELEEFSAMFGLFPGQFPVVSHCPADRGFSRRY